MRHFRGAWREKTAPDGESILNRMMIAHAV